MTEGFVPFVGPSGLVRRATAGGFRMYFRDAADRPQQWGAVVVLRLREDTDGTVAVGVISSPIEVLSRVMRLALFAAFVATIISRWREMHTSLAAWAGCGVALLIAVLSLRPRKDAATARQRLAVELRVLLSDVHAAVGG
jgi:hypothetical protein